MDTTDWRLVKKRTADADGAVYVSADGTRYRRTGGTVLRSEAAFQQMAVGLDYPVPQAGARGDERRHVLRRRGIPGRAVVERHRCTGDRIDKLLADLGQPAHPEENAENAGP
ncbi:hypothetical protein ACFWEH_01350 [Streptomyces anulatus]|uniref:hypothetical protein n=1 Tax=Streptomyces TaxID=1883 RepID=UPI00093CC6A4|nr:hypothetical protein [Streptomyces sp. TSRI0395]OKI78557.1 hypothetical protein AMK12_21810 [Streptomyces sp. TSRI0395]